MPMVAVTTTEAGKRRRTQRESGERARESTRAAAACPDEFDFAQIRKKNVRLKISSEVARDEVVLSSQALLYDTALDLRPANQAIFESLGRTSRISIWSFCPLKRCRMTPRDP